MLISKLFPYPVMDEHKVHLLGNKIKKKNHFRLLWFITELFPPSLHFNIYSIFIFPLKKITILFALQFSYQFNHGKSEDWSIYKKIKKT